jgi:hypothetical protein
MILSILIKVKGGLATKGIAVVNLEQLCDRYRLVVASDIVRDGMWWVSFEIGSATEFSVNNVRTSCRSEAQLGS